MKKKIKLILTVYEDDSCTIIYPDKVALAADNTNEPPSDGTGDNGGDRPPTGPKTP